MQRTPGDVGDQMREGTGGLGEWGVVGPWSSELAMHKEMESACQQAGWQAPGL